MVIKHRGAKSPKSTRKQAAQKQARAAATQQKGRAVKGFRRLKIRYEHRADIHLAFLQLGCALISLRFLR